MTAKEMSAIWYAIGILEGVACGVEGGAVIALTKTAEILADLVSDEKQQKKEEEE